MGKLLRKILVCRVDNIQDFAILFTNSASIETHASDFLTGISVSLIQTKPLGLSEHSPSASTSLIISSSSEGEGFCPSLLMTTPISSVVMKPLPS